MLDSWHEVGGPLQSSLFYQKALTGLLNNPITSHILNTCGVIHDYGCADGAGTAVLQTLFPHAVVKGFDINSDIIERAKNFWPPFIEFEQKDLNDISEKAGLIWCSHTLEHSKKPLEAVEKLRKFCAWLVLIVPAATPHHSFDVPSVDKWIPLIEPQPIFFSDFTTERKYAHERTLNEKSRIVFLQGYLKTGINFTQ